MRDSKVFYILLHSRHSHNLLDDTIRLLYCEYFNSFLSIAFFAEYYGISEKQARFIIEKGRKLERKKFFLQYGYNRFTGSRLARYKINKKAGKV